VVKTSTIGTQGRENIVCCFLKLHHLAIGMDRPSPDGFFPREGEPHNLAFDAQEYPINQSSSSHPVTDSSARGYSASGIHQRRDKLLASPVEEPAQWKDAHLTSTTSGLATLQPLLCRWMTCLLLGSHICRTPQSTRHECEARFVVTVEP
jgi:hypothetical protein